VALNDRPGHARAGLGRLVIADRDFVELSNLQRQVLFDEQDIADQLPKAIAAAHLAAEAAQAQPTSTGTAGR